jgi:hypothetical protein
MALGSFATPLGTARRADREGPRSGLPQRGVGGALAFPEDHAGDPQLPHEAFDRAAGDVVPVATQPQPESAGTEDLPLLFHVARMIGFHRSSDTSRAEANCRDAAGIDD